MSELLNLVKDDAECSARRWDGAVDSAEDVATETRWRELREACAQHYQDAIESIEAGDLNAAEVSLEQALALESEGGDSCDASHSLKAVRAARDMVTIEEMPDHLRASHRAARNWGVYPHNGAERRQVSRDEAEEIVADDPDGYARIL